VKSKPGIFALRRCIAARHARHVERAAEGRRWRVGRGQITGQTVGRHRRARVRDPRSGRERPRWGNRSFDDKEIDRSISSRQSGKHGRSAISTVPPTHTLAKPLWLKISINWVSRSRSRLVFPSSRSKMQSQLQGGVSRIPSTSFTAPSQTPFAPLLSSPSPPKSSPTPRRVITCAQV